MPRLYGFWLCAIEYAKCNEVEVFDLSQQQRDDLWSSLTDDEKLNYKLKAKEYNHTFGVDVNWRVYEEVVTVRHWGEECREDASKCSTASLPAPEVEEEDWDEELATATTTYHHHHLEHVDIWQGQIDDEDFPSDTSERLIAAGAEEEEAADTSERLIAAGAEEEEEELWREDAASRETAYSRGEDYTLEELFETIELDHPGYAHHRKQLPRVLFKE